MGAMTPLPVDHPMRVAWEAYKATDDYANTLKWAKETSGQHTEGSLWAAFAVGYQATHAEREALAPGREHLTTTGQFRSDKYPWAAAGFVPLKTTDPMAQDLLAAYAERRRDVDPAFADDLREALGPDIEPTSVSDYEEVLADHRTLVRQLDVILNGEEGAAKQASLADIVSQMEREGGRRIAYEPEGAERQEPKYRFSGGRVINRLSGEIIPLDEPIFIFRGRDTKAARTLRFYMTQIADNREHWGIVEERLKAFERFAEENPTRMKEPDTVPSEPAPVTLASDPIHLPHAPETPAQMLRYLAVWHAIHEARPASVQQTAMTQVYSALREVAAGDEVMVRASRDYLEEHFPGMQQVIWDANKAGGEASDAIRSDRHAGPGNLRRRPDASVNRMLIIAEELAFEAIHGIFSSDKQAEVADMIVAAGQELRRLQRGAGDNPIVLPRYCETVLGWMAKDSRQKLGEHCENAPIVPSLATEAWGGALEAIEDALP